MSTDTQDQIVQCSTCDEPVVLREDPVDGFQLECACEFGSLSVDSLVAQSSLFEPMSGRWSTIDADPGVSSDTRGAGHK